MAVKRKYLSTQKRIDAVIRLVEENYEPENQSKCLRAVWRYKVLPLYGISYRTMLNYLAKRKK
jgi:hypothetical protein